jgi:hypothetical protein
MTDKELMQQELVTDNTYNYAKNLAEAIFKQHFSGDEHYASGQIVWGVNDSVIGILTQIDNMVADMVRRPAQLEQDAVLSEREACAKVADRQNGDDEQDPESCVWSKAARHIAAAIRARGSK